jgi:hypothetical protein
MTEGGCTQFCPISHNRCHIPEANRELEVTPVIPAQAGIQMLIRFLYESMNFAWIARQA